MSAVGKPSEWSRVSWRDGITKVRRARNARKLHPSKRSFVRSFIRFPFPSSPLPVGEWVCGCAGALLLLLQYLSPRNGIHPLLLPNPHQPAISPGPSPAPSSADSFVPEHTEANPWGFDPDTIQVRSAKKEHYHRCVSCIFGGHNVIGIV